MLYIVEGNIGAGKSTFLSLLQQSLPEVTIVQEPVTSWSLQTQGQSLLANFYLDPKRWAYTLETFAMIARFLELQALQNNPGITIMERSLYSGHYCFAYNGYQQGFFDPVEWAVYNEWADFFLKQHCLPPHGFIYLQTNPTTCHHRVQKRSRDGEQTISYEYLNQIHQRHEQFLVHKADLFAELKDVPVLTLNTDKDFAHDASERTKHIQKLTAFMQETARP